MPAVNYNLMYQEMVTKTKGGFNQVLYWSRLLDWKNQTLTPNPDVIYLMPFFNTKDVGPVVLEIPPADEGLFNGSIMNYWQAAIEDVGPGGVDKGKGGKYLILPPGYDRTSMPAGYIAMPSDTYQGYALIRSVLKSGSEADIAKAVTYARRIKLYPLAQAANPPPTVFVDASDVVFDSTIPYDLRFFESLDRMVQAEPWLERDKAMIDPLKTIGIERGKPFKPDAKTQQILTGAIQEAKAWFEARYDTLPPFYEGEHWFFPSTEEMFQQRDERLEDRRFLSGRCPRHRLHPRLLQRQASGAIPVLSADRQGQGRQAAGGQVLLSSDRAGERAGDPVLVDDSLRPRHACLHPRGEMGRPLVADAGPAKERGRFGGHLLRTGGTGR